MILTKQELEKVCEAISSFVEENPNYLDDEDKALLDSAYLKLNSETDQGKYIWHLEEQLQNLQAQWVVTKQELENFLLRG
mgnify:CR=1 FL=1|tara:strand:- start:206 stop:445 length:240 start_codon:yes stop_codon:yes gene_type:complete